MNKNFFDFLTRKSNEMSLDDLEKELHAFGIECERKVELLNTDCSTELYGAFENKKTLATLSLPIEQGADFLAANDNSYALAA